MQLLSNIYKTFISCLMLLIFYIGISDSCCSCDGIECNLLQYIIGNYYVLETHHKEILNFVYYFQISRTLKVQHTVIVKVRLFKLQFLKELNTNVLGFLGSPNCFLYQRIPCGNVPGESVLIK